MKQRTDKHPTDWREGRRFRAWDLAQQGWKQQDIAAAVGVTQGAVSQWLTRARAGGQAALRRQPPAGRQPKLTPAQLAHLRRCSNVGQQPGACAATCGLALGSAA